MMIIILAGSLGCTLPSKKVRVAPSFSTPNITTAISDSRATPIIKMLNRSHKS